MIKNVNHIINIRKMPKTNLKSKTATQLLSLEEIILAIKNLPIQERQKVLTAFQYDDIPELKPLPYIITLTDDRSIDDQLEEIWQNRKPIDWREIDDIANKMDIQEPIEELLESLKL